MNARLFNPAATFAPWPAAFNPIVTAEDQGDLGVAVDIGAMFYVGAQPNFKTIVDYALYGFINGGSAIGLWELVSKQREK